MSVLTFSTCQEGQGVRVNGMISYLSNFVEAVRNSKKLSSFIVISFKLMLLETGKRSGCLLYDESLI